MATVPAEAAVPAATVLTRAALAQPEPPGVGAAHAKASRAFDHAARAKPLGAGHDAPLAHPSSNQWNQHIGKIWASLFDGLKIPFDSTIVEIAPGAMPKIGIGLRARGFKGRLYVVEPHPESLRSITSAYRRMLPQAQIVPIGAPLQKAIALLPRRVDAVVSNHPLDDMIIASALPKEQLAKFFSDHYVKPVDDTAKAWSSLGRDPPRAHRAMSMVERDWNALIRHARPAWTVISQYKIQFFQLHRIEEPDRYAQELLERMALKHGRVNEPVAGILRAQGQEPSRWLVISGRQ